MRWSEEPTAGNAICHLAADGRQQKPGRGALAIDGTWRREAGGEKSESAHIFTVKGPV